MAFAAFLPFLTNPEFALRIGQGATLREVALNYRYAGVFFAEIDSELAGDAPLGWSMAKLKPYCVRETPRPEPEPIYSD